jgi:hypothetical protein
MVIRRVHVPLLAPADVIPHLGAPHHWKEGRSAKLLIDQWWAANGLPRSVRAMLDQAEAWRGAVLLDAFAERCTSLEDGRPSPSQSDLLAVLGLGSGLGVLSIEAKVDEGFDKTVDQWFGGGGEGKAVRLTKLTERLGLRTGEIAALRYQLLHRTAAALIEAQRYRASHAAMIVQSWSADLDGYDDFCAFVEAIGVTAPTVGALSDPVLIDGVAIRLGWSDETAKA